MSNQRETNVADFIGECNAGILNDKLALALSDAAMSQLNHGIGSKKAKVSVEVTALKYLEIMSVQYYLNGEILISTKDKI